MRGHKCPECSEINCIETYCNTCTKWYEIKPTNSQEAMALAILEGEMDAALALADEVQMAYHHGPNYVSRQQLLDIIEVIFDYLDHQGDGKMTPEEIAIFQKLQRSGELANFKTLQHLLRESKEDVDAKENN